MKPILIIWVALPLLAGCDPGSGDAPPSKPETGPKTHPAVETANAILLTIGEEDAEGFYKHLNSGNRAKLRPDREKRNLPGRKKKTGGVTRISELVKGRRFERTGEVCGKIRVEGKEVFVLTLVPEKDTYRYEDINSPSIEQYEKLEKLWP